MKLKSDFYDINIFSTKFQVTSFKFQEEMSTTTEEIKNRLDIVDFISGYLRLQKAGRNFRALCPFHNEKTPSFMVSQERQIWHCFGCNESGDIFTFLEKLEGLEFKDALAELAQRAGVRLERFDSGFSSRRQKVYQTLEAAAGFFADNFWNSNGKNAHEYLIGRGLKDQTIKEFRVGYSLDSWDALLRFLENKEFSSKGLLEAGLVVRRDNAKDDSLASSRDYYDRFRNRIMFPISDIGGRVIGFSARVMPGGDDKMGKYINTSETVVYNKSRVVYGLDRAKLAIRKNGFCILVEGQLDVIMSYQAGVKNTAAVSGTALTAEHLAIIKRYTKNLALCFDSDQAGSNATKRAIDLAVASGLTTKVIVLGESKDPADIIKQDPKLWIKAISQKKLVVAFYFDYVFSNYDASDIEQKKKIADELLPVIKLIPNNIERAHYLQELARKIKTDEKLLEARMRELKDEFSSCKELKSNIETRAAKKVTRVEQLGEFILGAILLYPELKSGIIGKVRVQWFADGIQKIIFQELVKQGDNFKLEKFIDNLDESLKKEAGFIIFKTEQDVEQRNLEPVKIIDDYIFEFKKLHNKNQLNELILEIKQAEEKGDKELSKKLTLEFRRISSEM